MNIECQSETILALEAAMNYLNDQSLFLNDKSLGLLIIFLYGASQRILQFTVYIVSTSIFCQNFKTSLLIFSFLLWLCEGYLNATLLGIILDEIVRSLKIMGFYTGISLALHQPPFCDCWCVMCPTIWSSLAGFICKECSEWFPFE